jgi:hypothetical protein
MSFSRRLEYCGGYYIYGNFVHPCLTYVCIPRCQRDKSSLVLTSSPFISVHSSLTGFFLYFPVLAIEAFDCAVHRFKNAAPHRVLTVESKLATRAVRQPSDPVSLGREGLAVPTPISFPISNAIRLVSLQDVLIVSDVTQTV